MAKRVQDVAARPMVAAVTRDEEASPEVESRVGELRKLTGEAAPAAIEALTAGTRPEELVARGATIATSRVVTDCVRIYGQAIDFVHNGPVEARARLRGVTPALLAVAVYFLGRLVVTDRARRERRRSVVQVRSKRDLTVTREHKLGVALRDQAVRTLRDAAATSEFRVEVEQATGTAENDEALADGLRDLAALHLRWLDGDDQPLKTRLALAALDRPFADELAQASERVRAADEASLNRPAETALSQGVLDYLDGMCLTLLGQLIRAFDSGHAIDPRIPRLPPIATRRVFQRNRRAAPSPTNPSSPTANGHDPMAIAVQ